MERRHSIERELEKIRNIANKPPPMDPEDFKPVYWRTETNA